MTQTNAQYAHARLDRIKALTLKYINTVLTGVESGDSWFLDRLAECKSQWPGLTSGAIHERVHNS